MQTLRARVDLRVMKIKWYSAFPKLQLKWSSTIPLFSVTSRTLVGGVLLLWRDAVVIFCRPSRLGHIQIGKNFIAYYLAAFVSTQIPSVCLSLPLSLSLTYNMCIRLNFWKSGYLLRPPTSKETRNQVPTSFYLFVFGYLVSFMSVYLFFNGVLHVVFTR